MIETKRRLDLHWFDGAAASGGGEGGATADNGGVADPTSGEPKKVVYGKQLEPAPETEPTEDQSSVATGEEADKPDRKALFEKMIKEDYKDLYEERMKSTLDKRFKHMNGLQSDIERANSIIEPLLSLYGIEDGNLDKLRQSVFADNGMFEKAAEEAGMTVDQYMKHMETERENARLREAQEQREADEASRKLYESWLQQAEEMKEDYPDFDLEAECENEMFLRLINDPDMTVRKAYEATHLDEILKGTASTVAEAVRKNTVDTIRARGNRPPENGLVQQPGVIRKSDASKLTREDRAEIAKRAQKGETISF
jgi:hypothetical protein